MHPTALPFAIALILILVDSAMESKYLRYLGYTSIFLGHVFYLYSFLSNDFTLKEVFLYSSKGLPLLYKVSASWAGGGGFLVWWIFAFAIIALFKRSKGYNLMLVGLIAVAFLSGTFDSLQVRPIDGLGLNPALKNVWMLLHPPACFTSYALGLAVGVEALIGRGLRRLMELTWISLTLANVLGGVWSYYTLGWGGYWAWDPVETALLLPWLSSTAYFHSGKRYIAFLTAFSVVLSAFVTRGGISVLHGFANPNYFVILLGLPFLYKLFKDWEFESFDPSGLTTYSLLGSYTVCLLGLIYSFFASVSVDYFIFANMPFLLAFLTLLPICDGYRRIVVIPYVVSIVLTVFTALGFVRWFDLNSVNYATSFVIPIALFSFLLKVPKFKLIHLSIPLLVIAVTLSWPHAYYGHYNFALIDEKGTNVDGLKVKVYSVEFHQKGKVGFGDVEIPEEFNEVVHFRVDGRDVKGVVKLYMPYLLSGKDFIYTDPITIHEGLDDEYIVISNDPYSNYDLVMFTCKYLYETNQTHVLKFVVRYLNLDYEKVVEKVREWKPEGKVLIHYKRIPFVNLVWISCVLMLIGVWRW